MQNISVGIKLVPQPTKMLFAHIPCPQSCYHLTQRELASFLNHPLAWSMVAYLLIGCYVSTGRQPDLGGALSDCHLLSCVGVSPRGLQPILIRDGTLQHVYSETAALQPVRSCKQNTQ